jgi:hypothetical protein
LCFLTEDNVTANPGVVCRVAAFFPTENFNPAKSHLSRLKWRDPDGNNIANYCSRSRRFIPILLRREPGGVAWQQREAAPSVAFARAAIAENPNPLTLTSRIAADPARWGF